MILREDRLVGYAPMSTIANWPEIFATIHRLLAVPHRRRKRIRNQRIDIAAG